MVTRRAPLLSSEPEGAGLRVTVLLNHINLVLPIWTFHLSTTPYCFRNRNDVKLKLRSRTLCCSTSSGSLTVKEYDLIDSSLVAQGLYSFSEVLVALEHSSVVFFTAQRKKDRQLAEVDGIKSLPSLLSNIVVPKLVVSSDWRNLDSSGERLLN